MHCLEGTISRRRFRLVAGGRASANGSGTVRATVIGLQGDLAGHRFTVGAAPVKFGRESDNEIVVDDLGVSRRHAELRQEADGYVIVDLGSHNGTWVNGSSVKGTYRLRPGDTIRIGNHDFRYEVGPAEASPGATVVIPIVPAIDPASVLRVTITGGGPVGLAFALLLADLLGQTVAIRIYDGRWKRAHGRVVWKI